MSIGSGPDTEIVVDGRPVSAAAHPLLWAAVGSITPSHAARIEVGAGVPPGCGMGTSAAVVVALLAALSEWNERWASGDWRPASGSASGRPDRAALAAAAHAVETDLGWQSGIQDQQAAAWGGLSLIEMDAYPLARRTPIAVPAAALAELDRRLVTVYLGRPHHSSAVHEEVIARLEGSDPSPSLEPLRVAARSAAAALGRGDLPDYGAALISNSEAQQRLHHDLVGPDACAVIGIAQARGALGWKVNGAGGDGGTLTILSDPDPSALRAALSRPPWRVLDVRSASSGVEVRSA